MEGVIHCAMPRLSGDRHKGAPDKMRGRASRKRRTDPLADTPPEAKTLETERLLLEPLLPEHATLLFEGVADERLYRFIPSNPPGSVEALETRYRKLSSRRSPDGSEAWLNFAPA